jgi:hypothetical protein
VTDALRNAVLAEADVLTGHAQHLRVDPMARPGRHAEADLYAWLARRLRNLALTSEESQ